MQCLSLHRSDNGNGTKVSVSELWTPKESATQEFYFDVSFKSVPNVSVMVCA